MNQAAKAVSAAFPAPIPGALHGPDGIIIPASAYIRVAVLIGSPATPNRAKTAGILPCSRSSLWRWVKEGWFPAPVRLGNRMTAWRASDVAAWLASREA